MTSNQRLAADLADALADGRTDPGSLTDEQWYLLLLSAGINCPGANPGTVARNVLRRRATHSGYFADAEAAPLAREPKPPAPPYAA